MADELPPEESKNLWARRLGQVAMVIVIGIAFSGLIVGIKAGKTLGPQPTDGPAPADHSLPDTASADDPHGQPQTRRAPSYQEIGETDVGPNQAWHNELDKLAQARPDLFATVETNPELKAEGLAKRSEIRAYNGAPPVVPHPIDQRTAANCLACHQNGLKVGEAVAAPLPHPAYPNCTQCHVEGSSSMFSQAAKKPLTESTFEGVPAPTGGKRAWPGAPPTIPHSTWMRQNCNACHGQLGEAGLRTTHPWRNNCLQCHAPSADNDQLTTSPKYPTPASIFSNPQADDGS